MSRKNTILLFQNVTGKNKRFHLQNINLELQPGYIYSLIGENGAGKTTLMKYILNEDCKYEGKIYLNGEDIKNNHAESMNKIGYVSEENQFFEECTGARNAELLGMFFDDFNMEDFEITMQRMSLSTKKKYQEMSRGERLKFQLAFAMAHHPCLYLLDEVTVGMDPVFRMDFFEILRDLIKDEECSILMTSHMMWEVEMRTDFTAVMENGQLKEFVESPDIITKII